MTTNELAKLTGLKISAIDYLVRNQIIPVVQYGKGYEREFPPEALDIINERKKRLER